jgi:hypothetical protein
VLVAERGLNANYHYHAIQAWKIRADGMIVDAAV